MKKLLMFFVVFLVAASALAQAGKRYQSEIFSAYSMTSDIQYGQSVTSGGSTQNLMLDVYQPTGDTATKRPLVLFIHGGGFTSGDKVSGYGTRVCASMSKRGYIVASINYRLGVSTDTDSSYTQAIYRATQDAKAAIRFFRRYASTYKVDTSQIFVTGSSAGSKTALALAYWDQDEASSAVDTVRMGNIEGTSGNPGYTSNVHGVITCWGAITDYHWIEPGNVPVFCVHGTADATVPYDSSFGYHNLNVFKYGSTIINGRAKDLGIPTGLRLFINAGHTLDNDAAKQDSAIKDFSAWLYTILKVSGPATYYVNPDSGSDFNGGRTPETAWQTLSKVNSTTFVPGDSILIKSGSVWTGQLKPQGSGKSGAPIVIGMYGGSTKPIINGAGIIGEATVYLNNQEYIEVTNLEITNNAGTAGDRRGVLVAASNFGTVHHIYFKNLLIHDVKGIVGDDDASKRTAGIGIETTDDSSVPTRYDDVLIEGCTIYSIENEGIYTDNLSVRSNYPQSAGWLARRFTNVNIRNNVIHNISKNAIICRLLDGGVIEYNTCYETALGTTGNTMFTASCYGTIFQYNEGYYNRSTGADGSLYDADLRSVNIIFQYSYSHDNAHGLLWTCTVQEDSGIICRYNVSQNDKGNIFCINYPGTSVYCYNNTVYIGTGLSPTIISERNVGTGTRNYYFFNNIIYNNSTNASYDFQNSGYTRTIDYNIFYGNHPSGEPSDAHKLISNPLLVSPGTGSIGINTVDGYRLQSGSPAINSGILVPSNGGKDYWGYLAPDGVTDRGASEWQSISRFTISISALNGSVTKNPNQSSYDSAATVQLTPTPVIGYRFANWTGDVPLGHSTDSVLSLFMDGNKSITANFVAMTYSLTLNATNGSVGANPAGGTYNYGTSVSLTATPAVGYHFVSWTGDVPSGYENSNPVSIIMNANKTLTANFEAGQSSGTNVFYDDFNRADVTPVSSGGTPVMPYTTTNTGNGSASVSANMVKIICAPAGIAGRSYVTGPLSSYSPLFNSTLSSNLGVVTWTMNLRTNRSTQPLSGFDATKFGIATVLVATNSDLLASGCNGYAIAFGGSATREYRLVKFANGLGATANLTTIISATILGLTDGREYVSVKVTYNPSNNSWGLYERNDGSGGPFGDPTVLTDANLMGTIIDNSYTGTPMSAFGYFWNYNVSANTNNAFFDNFQTSILITHTIAATADLHGSISPTGAVNAFHGVDKRFVFIPDSGYKVDSVFVDGVLVDSSEGYTFPAVAADHTIRVTFGLANYTLQVLKEGNGVILPDTLISVAYGAIQTLTFVPSLGYFIDSVFVDGGYTGNSSSVEFTNINQNHIVRIKFSKKSYTLTVFATQGSVVKNPDQVKYDSGAVVQLLPKSILGAHFAYWSGSSTSGHEHDNPFTVVMDSNLSITANFEVTKETLSVAIRAKWNLVSIAHQVNDKTKNSIYPTSISNAFMYNGGYQTKDTLSEGMGYWMKFSDSQHVVLSGNVILSLEIALNQGWNLIGSISHPVAISSILTNTPNLVTSQFFGYSDGYVQVDTLFPGKAYWMKSNINGTILLSDSSSLRSKNVIKISKTQEKPPKPPIDTDGINSQVAPIKFELFQNYPNPFNPSTEIKFTVEEEGMTSLDVYNILGQKVVTLFESVAIPGTYNTVKFVGDNLPGGIYMMKLNTLNVSGKVSTKFIKMLMLK